MPLWLAVLGFVVVLALLVRSNRRGKDQHEPELGRICPTCNQQFGPDQHKCTEEHHTLLMSLCDPTKSTPLWDPKSERLMIATKAIWDGKPMNSDKKNGDLAVIQGEEPEYWIGYWFFEREYVGVRFLKSTTKLLDDNEVALYSFWHGKPFTKKERTHERHRSSV